MDEVHEMKENTIIKSIEQSQSIKDAPQMWIITTEGFVNDGVLDNLLIDCRKIINGEDEGISAERTLRGYTRRIASRKYGRIRNHGINPIQR